MQRRIVRYVKYVAGAVGRIKMHREQDVGCCLSHLHAEPLHVFRQARQRVLHPVLRQHLRDIEVGADPERHGQGELPVAGRLAVDVEHVLDAVDLLLERCRDRSRNCFRGGAGIDGCDLNCGRHDLRILCDRQDGERAKADQRYEHAEHGGKDRPVYKGVCHGKAPVSAFVPEPLYFQPCILNLGRRPWRRSGWRRLAARPWCRAWRARARR